VHILDAEATVVAERGAAKERGLGGGGDERASVVLLIVSSTTWRTAHLLHKIYRRLEVKLQDRISD
jgi:hypothetical protein